MQEENYLYLTNSFALMKFDGVFDQPLKSGMILNKPEISLKSTHNLVEGGIMIFDFRLTKGKPVNGKESDRYFINKVIATLPREGMEPLKHEFILFNQGGYEVRQMENLMLGRSVFREYNDGNKMVELWRRIDFQAKDKYNNNLMRSTYSNKFNLEREVNKLPIQAMSAIEKATMMHDLKYGERAPVIIKIGANKVQAFAEATPHLGRVTLFDTSGERILLDNNKLRSVSDEEVAKLSESTMKMIGAQQNQSVQQGQQQSEEKQRGQRRAS